MRSRLTAVVVLAYALGAWGTPIAPLTAQPEKKAPEKEKNKEKPKVSPPAPQTEMVTVYMHYFFPNYTHGYYIGWTMTVPVQVPVQQAHLYSNKCVTMPVSGFGDGHTGLGLHPETWHNAFPR